MSRIILKVLILILIGFTNQLKAQTRIFNLTEKLTQIGFENIRVVQTGNELFVSFEDNIYRWNVSGIRVALDSISKYVNEKANLTLFILQSDIPIGVLSVPIEAWHRYVNGLLYNSEIPVDLQLLYTLESKWKTLEQTPSINPSTNKIDLVLYPQFFMQNIRLSQIYEIQLNLSPAIHVSLWKGMLFNGQVVFPIVNELGTEGDYIRPGFVTLSQDFRLPTQWFCRYTIGNFNANCYGADLNIYHPLKNNHWNIGINAGLTGGSHFNEGKWIKSELNTLTWFVKAGYFYPRLNLQFDLSYGSYLNKDYGFRADCTRHFGETTVGFYAMYTGGKPNGGFHFSVPLSPIKRNRKHIIRIVPPRFFDWEYNAGTEFFYGRYYETRPNENRSEHWINSIFMENEILKTN